MHHSKETGTKQPMLIGSLLLALCASHSLTASSLSGKLRDQVGTPIDGARITVWEPGTDKQYQTATVAGLYSFKGIPQGDYLLKVEKTGMALLYGAARLTTDDHHELNLVLVKNPSGVAPIVKAAPPYGTPAMPMSRLPKIPAGKVKQSRLLYQVQPAYPGKQWAPGLNVQTAAVIRTNGVLDDMVVLSAPDPDFALATLMALRRWRYSPTYLDGQAVEVTTTIDLLLHPR
jgi:Carboxypeptidase regulatory-like domain/Gram-negative bacterial TonB protein C-terminal